MKNFFDKCISSEFDNSCYFGYFVLVFGLFVLLSNLYAFLKMTKYYGKMNFENTILLLSLIQSIILLFQMILSYEFFECLFIFIQILSMTLINYKFEKISIGYINIKYSLLNKVILGINIIYLIIYFTLLIPQYVKNLFYLNIFYFILEIFSSFYLKYHCSIFLNLIKQDKKKLKEKKEQKDNLVENNKNLENFIGINMIGEGLFYLIKKRQLSLIYFSNLLLSIIEFILDIIFNFHEQISSHLYLIFYIDFFVYFIHNIIIFISFYWMVRKQYISNNEKNIIANEVKNENLIDEKFIEEEESHIEEENKRITKYLNDEKNSSRATKNKIIGGKINDNDNDSIRKQSSRNSTFDENDNTNTQNIV